METKQEYIKAKSKIMKVLFSIFSILASIKLIIYREPEGAYHNYAYDKMKDNPDSKHSAELKESIFLLDNAGLSIEIFFGLVVLLWFISVPLLIACIVKG